MTLIGPMWWRTYDVIVEGTTNSRYHGLPASKSPDFVAAKTSLFSRFSRKRAFWQRPGKGNAFTAAFFADIRHCVDEERSRTWTESHTRRRNVTGKTQRTRYYPFRILSAHKFESFVRFRSRSLRSRAFRRGSSKNAIECARSDERFASVGDVLQGSLGRGGVSEVGPFYFSSTHSSPKRLRRSPKTIASVSFLEAITGLERKSDEERVRASVFSLQYFRWFHKWSRIGMESSWSCLGTKEISFRIYMSLYFFFRLMLILI